jgi:hypothetical protein
MILKVYILQAFLQMVTEFYMLMSVWDLGKGL